MKKYPTLKEVFLPEISKDISKKYISKMKNRSKRKIYKKLDRLSKIINKFYNSGVSPTKAAELLKNFISSNPDVNPLKSFDTLGIKMFLYDAEKESVELGKEKRYYENVLQAYMRNYL